MECHGVKLERGHCSLTVIRYAIAAMQQHIDAGHEHLKEWLDNQETNHTDTHVYTDQFNDLTFRKHTEFAYLVDPYPRLKALADQPNWSTLDWD